MTCAVDDCDRPVLARGWCSKHYQKWRTYGDPCAGYERPTCVVDDCPTLADARGLCRRHYAQVRREEMTVAEIEYAERKRDMFCTFCDAARLLDARGYSLHEAARQQRKAPAWLRQHLDDHGLSDVLSHHREDTA